MITLEPIKSPAWALRVCPGAVDGQVMPPFVASGVIHIDPAEPAIAHFAAFHGDLTRALLRELVDMNGVGGTAVGTFGFAEGTGRPGGLQDEVVGIYGRADKNGPYWATGVHGECVVDAPDTGGSCIGLNTELIGRNTKSLAIGINVQPRPEIRNAIGLQFQEPAAYRYAISMPNMAVKLGDVDTDDFCMRFDPKSQRLEFWRACNRAWTTRVGYIDMNYGAPDVPLNR